MRVERLAYRHRGSRNLHPADAVLNLPKEKHSHGLRRLAAIEASRGSFDATVDAIERSTGCSVAKRQVEALTTAAATDVEAFYDTFAPEPGSSTDVPVISCDGKGIVMRPDSLRPSTQRAAAKATTKLDSRLSKGEKRVGTPNSMISRLNTGPTRTPVNASPAPLRMPTHDSGPSWVATPST